MLDHDYSSSSVGRKLDKTLWVQPHTPDATSENESNATQPPAKTIRLDGREVVLGTSDVARIAADDFWNQLSSLLDKHKYLTASNFVARNADTAEQILWEKWATDPDARQVRFVAKITSQNIARTASWNALLETAKKRPTAARSYHLARSTFEESIRTKNPSNADVEQLRIAAQGTEHPLAMVEAMRLMAIGELVAGRSAWAESLLLQAIEQAEQHQDNVRVADLWLMVATTAMRSGDHSRAAIAWETAVASYVNVDSESKRPLNARFWIRADRHRPNKTTWPAETKQALMVFAEPVGCRFSDDSPIDLVIWSAVGSAQLDGREPQLALINFKKAETFASGEDVIWLRIAQSKCLAALGQTQAAAASLSEPLASNNPVIAAAANAALGSAKLQASAFQQGFQLLSKAIGDPSLEWPTKNEAEADLALARLILGETDQGLKSLHAAQRKFEIQGKPMSLLQSLENELQLLQHEGKTDAATRVLQRMHQIESP